MSDIKTKFHVQTKRKAKGAEWFDDEWSYTLDEARVQLADRKANKGYREHNLRIIKRYTIEEVVG